SEMDARVAGRGIARAGCRLVVKRPAILSRDPNLCTNAHPVAFCSGEPDQEPVIPCFGDVAEDLHRRSESRDDQIHASIVVQIAERQAPVRRWLYKVCPCGSAHVFKSPVSQIAKDGVGFSVAKMPGYFPDVVEHVAAGYHQILPAVVIEIDDGVGPAGHRPGQIRECALVAAVTELSLSFVEEDRKSVV